MKAVKNIVLDFGHGGVDRNGRYTTAPYKMFKFPNGELAYEGQINRRIGGLVKMYLLSYFPMLNIVTTVKVDDVRDIALSHRVRVCNSFPAAETIFVSIHSNASPTHKGTGFEIYTSRGQTESDNLANYIGRSVQSFYEQVNLMLRFDFEDGDLDKEKDFYVVKKSNCPAVLIECLFFDNYHDFTLLKSPAFQRDLAWFIFMGIINYLNSRTKKKFRV